MYAMVVERTITKCDGVSNFCMVAFVLVADGSVIMRDLKSDRVFTPHLSFSTEAEARLNNAATNPLAF